MARKIRIEYPGACYHIINRGNYRSYIFESQSARRKFLKTLRECSHAKGWILHAWCLMGNHYHLCLQTPEPNLVEGMRWLQSTFANHFNRVRKTSGHVFQGRYKAILLDGHAQGSVCHYIHLNPVRAGMVEATQLQNYAHSSFHQLMNPRKRWSCCDYSTALDAAGHLSDTSKGRELYKDYLSWLAEEESSQKRMGFENLCKGWAQGTKEFKERILSELTDSDLTKAVEGDAAEVRNVRYDRALQRVLQVLSKTAEDIEKDLKGEPWKVAAARYLREQYLAPNKWIAEHLKMGAVSHVQSKVSCHRKLKSGEDQHWEILKKHEKLD